jgi:hypothetical protein
MLGNYDQSDSILRDVIIADENVTARLALGWNLVQMDQLDLALVANIDLLQLLRKVVGATGFEPATPAPKCHVLRPFATLRTSILRK